MGARRVLLGRIVGVHGVHGAVKLESFTEPRLAIFAYRPWLLERESGAVSAFAAPAGHAQGKGIVAALPGIADRDAAAAWTGARIWVARAALPEPEAGELYWTDLEGLQVENLAGEELGTVSHLFDNGAHPVLVARADDGRQHLVPWIPEKYVKSVDLAARRIVVDWNKDD